MCAATLQRYVKDPFGNEQHERGHADHPGTRGYEFPAMENEEVSEKDQSIAKRGSNTPAGFHGPPGQLPLWLRPGTPVHMKPSR